MPGIAWMEAIEGVKNKQSMQRLVKLFEPVRVVWPDRLASEYAVSLLRHFRLSHGLRKYDALVAVTALAANEALHTFNVRHYRFIPGLRTVQPYDKVTDGGED